jgi:methionyl-tRNA synthetase
VSGLAGLIPLEQLKGARVVVVCNLKPATMKGIESTAMVLCASEEAGGAKSVQIVTPPASCEPGERVTFPGYEGEPEANPNAIKKKKVWEAVVPDLKTDSSNVATYKGVPFTTSHGVCTVKSLANAQIK